MENVRSLQFDFKSEEKKPECKYTVCCYTNNVECHGHTVDKVNFLRKIN